MSLRINDTAPISQPNYTGNDSLHQWLETVGRFYFRTPRISPGVLDRAGLHGWTQAGIERRNCKILGLSVDR